MSTITMGRLGSQWSWKSGAVLLAVFAIVMAAAWILLAQVGPTGQMSVTAPTAPYTEAEPYAPYTAGPVVREIRPTEYAPYPLPR